MATTFDTFIGDPIDINKINSYVIVDVARYESAGVQVSQITGATWGTAVVKVLQSCNGINYYAFASPLSIAVGGGVIAPIDVTGIASLKIVVTTAEGAAGTALATVIRKRNN